MIKQVILNSIKDHIGHIPNRDELQSCFAYIADAYTDKFTMTNIDLEIMNWRNDTLRRCSECDEWFLPEQTIELDDGLFICESENCRESANDKLDMSEHRLTAHDLI